MTEPQSAAETLGRVRTVLFVMYVAGTVLLLAELFLSKHTEDLKQLIPIGLLVTGLPIAVWCRLQPTPGSVGVLRGLLVLFALSGLLGVYLHYSAKTEFALERQPDLAGWALVRESIKGSSPPILAPLAMAALAMLGLAWTYRYSRRRDRHDAPRMHTPNAQPT